MQMTYIYILIDPKTHQVRYVGKSNDPTVRLKNHLNNISTKSHRGAWLKSLIKENSQPELIVIDTVETSEWIFWEKHYISLYKSFGYNLTNSTDGGDGGGSKGKKRSAETKERMRIAALNRAKRTLTEQHKQKIRKAHKARNIVITDEQKRVISLKNTGKKRSIAAREKMRLAQLGKTHTDETKRRMSETHKKLKNCNE